MSNEIKILFDTDIGCDCDDAGAMAVLHELANQGECSILAVTHCCAGEYNAGCIDAINRYFGRPEIPVGMFHPEDHVVTQWRDVYARSVARRFPNRFSSGRGLAGGFSESRGRGGHLCGCRLPLFYGTVAGKPPG